MNLLNEIDADLAAVRAGLIGMALGVLLLVLIAAALGLGLWQARTETAAEVKALKYEVKTLQESVQYLRGYMDVDGMVDPNGC